MREVIDQMERCVWVPDQPKRIISLVPSQTELLYDLGLQRELIGLTKFCVHPKGFKKEKTIIGGTKSYKLDVIHALKPDLIIGNKEENEQNGIEELAHHFPVWMSDISNLQQALDMISRIGHLTHKTKESDVLSQQIRSSFELLRGSTKEKVVYLIWKDPMMIAGQGTFINDMLNKCGFINLVQSSRYPELTERDLIELAPQRLFLSSEPFPFKQKQISYFQRLLPDAKVQLVDGEMFSWYGSRLTQAPEYFNTLIQ